MAEPTQPLAETLVCVECGRKWVGPVERWRVYLSDEDPPVPVTYCPDCAENEREFA
jgi:hypothetical protein